MTEMAETTETAEALVAAVAARYLRADHVRCHADGRRVEGLDFDGEARLVPGGWRVEVRTHGAAPWDEYVDWDSRLPEKTAAFRLARLCERAHAHLAERREIADAEQMLRSSLRHGAPTDAERPTWANSSWEENYSRDRTRVTARIQFGPFMLERVLTAHHYAPPVWAWSRIRLTALMGLVATKSPWWTWAARQVAEGTIPAALLAAAFEAGRQYVSQPGDHITGWYEAVTMVWRVEAARQWAERIPASGPGDPGWGDMPDPIEIGGRGDDALLAPAEFDAAAAWAQTAAAFPRLRVYLVDHAPTGTVRAIATTTQERAAELAGTEDVGWEIPSYLPRDEQRRLARALTGAPTIQVLRSCA